jgi:hypothetical protein
VNEIKQIALRVGSDGQWSVALHLEYPNGNRDVVELTLGHIELAPGTPTPLTADVEKAEYWPR